MSTPPLLIGATLVFWGWLTGYLVVGAILAVVVEAARWLKLRWEFSHEDYNQVWNLCSVLFLGGALYSFTSNDGAGAVTSFFQANSFTARSGALNQAAKAVYVFVQWLPMIFYPMALVQAYGTKEKIEFSTFSWIIRRKLSTARREGTLLPEGGLNVAYPYFGLCLISASAVPLEDARYFFGVCLLAAYALWQIRSRRFAKPVWIAIMLAVCATAFGLLQSVKKLEQWVDLIHTQWVSGFTGRGMDHRETMTALGRVDALKLSSRIVLRIETESTTLFPLLLRECAYDDFRSPRWGAKANDMNVVVPEANETSWVFVTNHPPKHTVRISAYLPGGGGVLNLPHNTVRIDNLNVAEMHTNHLGTVKVAGGPGLAIYEAQLAPPYDSDASPGLQDIAPATNEIATIERVAAELKLDGSHPKEALSTLSRWFAANFTYSLGVKSNALDANGTPLKKFLLETHSGHCEYFATATTLLLRQAGIPARYVVGYSVSEKRGKMYVARDRDAHAWCIAWVDGVWTPVDNTPASWHQSESGKGKFFERIKDFFSDLWFRFSEFRWGKSNYRQYAVWLVVPLAVVIVYRLMRRQRKRKADASGGKGRLKAAPLQGLDSELYEVERRLAALGLGRLENESIQNWILRVQADPRVPAEQLRALLPLHHRLRFDPLGLPGLERDQLRMKSKQCVETLSKS